MSWVALQPAAPPRPKQEGAVVTISVSKPGPIIQRAYLTVRTELLPDGGLDWWTNRRPVAVEIGEGDHAGRIRLRDQGPFRTMGATGKHAKAGKPAAPMLQIPGLPGLPADGMARHSVAWEIVGDALVVILPWAKAIGMTKAVAAAPAASSTDKARPVPIKPAPPVAVPPPPVAAKPVVAPAKALPSTAVPYPEIERWAIANGLGSATHGFDLAKVNERRIANGERPWTILRRARQEGSP